MQQRVAQLEEELRREREEKARAVRELEELRREDGAAKGVAEKVQLLEREVDKSKESERKMLESLIYQTKQLEQTKISLEEARLEIATLQQANKTLEFASARRGGAEQPRSRSRKALDDVSVALADVTMEAKQVKAWLSEAQAEVEAGSAEVGRLRAALAAASAERDRSRLEADECAAAWGDKERVLLDCVRAAEEEAGRARRDNTKLVESQRVIRDENARLRDVLKQAVADASAVRDSLELARADNARLNDAVADKESALRSLRQEYDCVRVSEAAAQASLKELNTLLAATTTTTACRCSTPASAPAAATDRGFDQRVPNGSSNGPTLPQWLVHADKPRTPAGSRRFSQSARMGSQNPKERVFASLSNVADLKSAADAAAVDLDDEFDHVDESHYVDVEEEDPMKRKKRPILRKFGDLFRRKSFYKPNNLAPVHTL
ncbi:hypothetical protein Zm00014a_033513 [Zea mays]|uniref:Uncharacterized protein n=1 Tax=Zea mays TaxID=4577 RepID=A0A3L6G9U3_MAIZE|nr:hypothetical protein Zm00014a_033513 [Zea mays]